jgi:hypothetical protein
MLQQVEQQVRLGQVHGGMDAFHDRHYSAGSGGALW